MPAISFIKTGTGSKSPSGFYFGLAAILVITTGLFLELIQPGTLYTDGGIFSAVAWKDMHGGTLYVDAWENKPPGIFYLLELFMFLIPHHVYALFILAFLAFWCIGIVLFNLFYKYFDSSLPSSVLFTSIAMFFTLNRNNIGDGLMTEIYGTLCILGSLYFFERHLDKKTRKPLVLSGITMGLSVWFKEPFLLVVLPLCLYYFLQLKQGKLILKFIVCVLVPGIFFIILLSANGSLAAFFNVIKYNLGYVSGEDVVPASAKINDFYQHLFKPVAGLCLLLIFILLKLVSNRKNLASALLILFMFLGSTAFVLLTPYNFGHYYFPSFVLFFVMLGKEYEIFRTQEKQSYALPVILVCLFSIYSIDHELNPRFSFSIKPFKPDHIAEKVIQDKGKTLFVDYVDKGGYYIICDRVHPFFVPVGLAVHFGETSEGKENRQKFYEQLMAKRPDYVITSTVPSYLYCHIWHQQLYKKAYEKIDSIVHHGDGNVYLLRRKNME